MLCLYSPQFHSYSLQFSPSLLPPAFFCFKLSLLLSRIFLLTYFYLLLTFLFHCSFSYIHFLRNSYSPFSLHLAIFVVLPSALVLSLLSYLTFPTSSLCLPIFLIYFQLSPSFSIFCCPALIFLLLYISCYYFLFSLLPFFLIPCFLSFFLFPSPFLIEFILLSSLPFLVPYRPLYLFLFPFNTL